MSDERMESESEGEGTAELSKAIKRLDKTQHIKAPSREGEESADRKKACLPALLKLLSSSEHADLGKDLKNQLKKKSTLSVPLERREAEKIKRTTGFLEIKAKLDRWNAIVAKNRSAEQLKFPLLELDERKITPKDDYLNKYQLKSTLEKELEQLDPKEEEAQVKRFPLTMAEMIEHRKEAARMRAKQSYIEAKARRQSKIKSKKFHRIQRKEKMKLQLKEFEVLQKSNPEEALRKLEQLEMNRAEERVTLRHKSTGKWAQNKLVRAKYNKEARQELAEQLTVSKELTQKVNVEESESEIEEELPVQINSKDANNPWLKSSDQSNEYVDFVSGYKKYWEDKNKSNEKGTEVSDEEVGDQVVPETIAETKIKVKKVNQNKKRKTVVIDPINKKRKTGIVSTSAWKVESTDDSKKIDLEDAFDELELKYKNKIKQKIDSIQSGMSKRTRGKIDRKSDEYDELEKLTFKRKSNKAIIDEEMDETSNKDQREVSEKNKLKKIINSDVKLEDKDDLEKIDPDKFVPAKTRNIKSTLPDMDIGDDFLDDDDEKDDNKMTIAEAFEDDDIVASFQQEKQDEITKSKPKIDDSYLPGWGSWTGKNMAAPRRKHKPKFFKEPQNIRRKDDRKDNLIIKEGVSDKMKEHLVSELPFPFNSVKDFEATIRAPLGSTFVTETAHKKLTKPAVVVKSGVIINPMDESQLVSNQQLRKKAKN